MTNKQLNKHTHMRQFILEGSIPKVIMRLTFPLLIYGFFNYLYGFFDIILAASMGGNEIASVVFIEEIKNTINAFGVSIAAGGTVIVARHFGAGNMVEARKNAGSAFMLAFIVSMMIVIVTLLFGKQLLLLLNAPKEIIEVGIGYFNIQMITTTLFAVNSVYFGLEKAKGNTKRILIISIIAMVFKMILSTIFVFIYHFGPTEVALATLISQLLLVFIAFVSMFSKNNIFYIRLKELAFTKQYILPIVLLSLPVFAGKFLFSLGKVFVNSMAAVYGPLALGALGIAMRMGGGAGTLGTVFEESETSIVSMQLGQKNLSRALKTYQWSHILGFGFAVFGLTIMTLLLPNMVNYFAANKPESYHDMIYELFQWEKYSALTSSSIAIITGLFVGFKLTKVSFMLNASRLFLFRIPLLWLFIQQGYSYVALGLVMFWSNLLTMIIAFIMLIMFYIRIHKQGYQEMTLERVIIS